jgi:Na+/H+-dicarboxylate symporter
MPQIKSFLKKYFFPLYIQIVLALVLGAVFGAVFPINHDKLIVEEKLESGSRKTEIDGWDKITFLLTKKADSLFATDSVIYISGEQLKIINFFKKQKENPNISIGLIIEQNGASKNLAQVSSIEKQPTIATVIKPIGDIFIRLLSFLAIPLVIASLIMGAASLEDIKKLGRIGIKTFALFVTTTALAITIGLLTANIIRPGERLSAESKERLLGEYQAETSEKITQNLEVDLVDFIVQIVPKNPIRAMADGNMLQIVFFAVVFGAACTFVDKSKTTSLLGFFGGASEVMIKMVGGIMKLAPFGVFALISSTIAEFGIDIIMTLFWYMFSVVLALAIHTIFVYSGIVKFFGNMSPRFFFKGMQTAQAISFSTSSSAATLPVTLDCVENKLGIPKQISGFVLPLGATINMDGTALYQGVAAVFIAQVYGCNLDIAAQLTIIFTAVLASIGTAPVPGVGIIMLVMILQAVHIPPEGIALIIGVDRILDMCRTITNVSGDASIAVAVNNMESKRVKKHL